MLFFYEYRFYISDFSLQKLHEILLVTTKDNLSQYILFKLNFKSPSTWIKLWKTLYK